MLTLVSNNTYTEEDAELGETRTFTNYVVDGTVDGVCGAQTVRVYSIHVIETKFEDDNDDMVMVNVEHNSTRDIYGDIAFEKAISAALGMEVSFTESGMQDDGYASMEA